MSGGIDGVFVSNVKCVAAGCLIDVKSTLGRGGYIRNVHLSDCAITGSLNGAALQAADNYGDNNGPVNRSLVPVVDGIFISRVSTAPGAVIKSAGTFEGLGDTAQAGKITGVVLQDVSIGGGATAWKCVNVSGTSANVAPAPCSQLQGRR